MQDRLIPRSSMWSRCRSPNVPTFGQRNTNFVESTHHAFKRHGLNRSVRLWKSVHRATSIFEQMLERRQASLQTPSSNLFQLESVNTLVASLVPQAAQLMKKNMEAADNMENAVVPTGFIITERNARYQVNTGSWSCSCMFAVDYMLPCRHALTLYYNVFHHLGKQNY